MRRTTVMSHAMANRPAGAVSPVGSTWDGDPDTAVEQLYAAHWRSLVRLSVLLVRDVGTAEEVVQDAFVEMHGRWSRLRDPDKALAYLRRAVVNRSRSRLRHLTVVRAHASPATAHRASYAGADEAVLEGDRRSLVLDALARCPTGSARCWRCATTSTSPRPRSPRPSASAAAPSRATRRAARPPCVTPSPNSGRNPVSDDPRLDPRFDSRMSELISDAVSDVEPRDGLQAIRSRTRPSTKENPMATSRNWLFAVGGAVVGTAAVILAITVVANLNDDGGRPTRPVRRPPPRRNGRPDRLRDSPDRQPERRRTPRRRSRPRMPSPVYFVGDGPRGPVLFREFQPGIGADPVAQAASAAVAGPPRDPDYRTLWPAGTQATASYDGDVDHRRPPSGRRPARQAAGHVQADGRSWRSSRSSTPCRAPPRSGRRAVPRSTAGAPDQVLGEPASEPLAATPTSSTRSRR